MKIGFIGLGRMGLNMVTRLLNANHEIAAYALSAKSRQAAVEKGAQEAVSLPDLVSRLDAPRVVWVMVPSGTPTESTVQELSALLAPGDIVIDGGNSNYKDSLRRADMLKAKRIDFLDCGTSGGIWGLTVGYCLMIGGDPAVFAQAEPLFKTLAPKDGYLHAGPNGAGHFVKMVHNGIEYGMMQAYAEGFQLLEGKKEFNLDLSRISHLWNQGSVVRSWLLELAERAFKNDAHLDQLQGYVEDSGEGRWTVAEAIEQDLPAPVITLALLQRLRSRQSDSFSDKVLAALRNEFGGHAVKKSNE